MNRRDFMKGTAMGLIGAGVTTSGLGAAGGQNHLLLQPRIDDGVPSLRRRRGRRSNHRRLLVKPLTFRI